MESKAASSRDRGEVTEGTAQMPIKISAAMRAKLLAGEGISDPEVRLWDKAGGVCFLCGAKVHESTDVLVADHDVPESENGPTTIENLNLVHTACNAFKRNHPTVNVRPYLRLSEKIKAAGGFAKYDQAVALMGVQPTPVDFVDAGTSVEVSYPSRPKGTYPVFSESNKEGTFRFAFVELTRDHIFNDDECQPRTIKLQHVWSIYADINRNPLHEAPACRMIKVPGSVQSFRPVMFDGQHKAISFWIADRSTIVIKVYLDLSKQQAIRLVNSVQAKIKKLPLSPFELSAKMSEEWQDRVSQYETAVGTDGASEDGFIKWVGQDERSRAKSAFEDALIEDVLGDAQLAMREIVGKSDAAAGIERMTEAAFRNKVLKPLLHMSPLKESFPDAQKLRQRERTTAIKLLNLLYVKAFKFDGTESPQDRIRAKRMMYQSALNYTISLLRRFVGYLLTTAEPRQLLEKEPDSQGWAQIEAGLDRLVKHPVWTADFTKSTKMTAVRDALTKNQDAQQSFAAVGLKLGYITGADPLDDHCLD